MTPRRTPFEPLFEELPPTLPVFPLAGVLLLPRGHLPLNIFEPRYLAMVGDALGQGRMIGMIQPRPPELVDGGPDIYATGCAGRITSFSETDDGRFLITLTGVCRFRIGAELPLSAGGYRQVRADYGAFRDDLAAPTDNTVDRTRLREVLSTYFEQHQIPACWDAIADTDDETLITSLAMACAFSPTEKQALLESRNLYDRSETLIALLEMAVYGGVDRYVPNC